MIDYTDYKFLPAIDCCLENKLASIRRSKGNTDIITNALVNSAHGYLKFPPQGIQFLQYFDRSIEAVSFDGLPQEIQIKLNPEQNEA